MTIDTLRHVPLFESLDDEAAKELCKLIETLDRAERQVLFRAGDVGDAMYLIERGKVRISVRATDGHDVTLTELAGGDFFGEMALLDRQPRSASATVAENARLAVLSREHFLSFMRSNPNVALEMLTAQGLRAEVVRRARVPFGPVLSGRTAFLEAAGLIEPGQRTEELVVLRAGR